MKILLSMIMMVFSLSGFGTEAKMDTYLKIQDALASDDFKTAAEAHKKLCKEAKEDFKEKYKDCGKSFKGIDELRESFKTVSKIFIKNFDEKEAKDLVVVECPMAGAKWIQKEGSIRNPYYGKSMLACGEKK